MRRGRADQRRVSQAFANHWTFLLGEIALYAFVVVLVTGVFLTFFFKPSMEEVVYNGAYVPLRGVTMSQAYASSLEISFEVRGGLLIRQMHHWGTLIFIGGIVAHLLRNFFTGAFRKPRELNWLIGVALFGLVMLNGLFGYSLPDDLLSGAGLRILHGVTVSVPLVGTYLAMFLFGGEFPGGDRLVHGVPGGRATAHAAVGVHRVRPHRDHECADPRTGGAGAAVRRPGAVPVRGAVGHW
jgi:ubiquinol-cytochrome c reductase cytochrome b subunit